MYRYTDEGVFCPLRLSAFPGLTHARIAGDLTELCRWTVDLAALPRFQHIAQDGGGYIECVLLSAIRLA